MDTIEIRGLRLRCLLGVTDEERRDVQDVVLDLDIDTNARAALSADEIGAVWNYRTAVKGVIGHVEASRYQTVERLAQEVARLLVVEHHAPAVTVRVHKAALRFADSVGIVVQRTTQDYPQPDAVSTANGHGGDR